MEGTVKFFNDTKGFGFITTDEGSELFVHATGCKEKIRKDDRVSFEITEGKKGQNATSVVLL